MTVFFLLIISLAIQLSNGGYQCMPAGYRCSKYDERLKCCENLDCDEAYGDHEDGIAYGQCVPSLQTDVSQGNLDSAVQFGWNNNMQHSWDSGMHHSSYNGMDHGTSYNGMSGAPYTGMPDTPYNGMGDQSYNGMEDSSHKGFGSSPDSSPKHYSSGKPQLELDDDKHDSFPPSPDHDDDDPIPVPVKNIGGDKGKSKDKSSKGLKIPKMKLPSVNFPKMNFLKKKSKS